MNPKPENRNLWELDVLLDEHAVCKLSGGDEIPHWADQGGLMAIIRNTDELTVVCRREWVPEGVLMEPGWRALRVRGTLDFQLVGVLAALTAVLADVGVSVYALSTYETDILLVKEEALITAMGALRSAGHNVLEIGK
jgi:hypothetical protein